MTDNIPSPIQTVLSALESHQIHPKMGSRAFPLAVLGDITAGKEFHLAPKVIANIAETAGEGQVPQRDLWGLTRVEGGGYSRLWSPQSTLEHL